jgi:hypothetical protein
MGYSLTMTQEWEIREMHTKCWSEILTEKYFLEELCIDRRIILK